MDKIHKIISHFWKLSLCLSVYEYAAFKGLAPKCFVLVVQGKIVLNHPEIINFSDFQILIIISRNAEHFTILDASYVKNNMYFCHCC